MKRLAMALLFSWCAILVLPAQSNQLIDRMLEDEGADAADATYLVLLSAGIIDESASTADALSYARREGWLPEAVEGGETITFGVFAYLIMEAHGESGGIMYTVIPGPRYAAREANFQEWSVERRSQDEEISGETAIRILGNYLASKEER